MSRDAWLRRQFERKQPPPVDRRPPAERLGYVPCPTCGGRKVKSSISAAVNGVHCQDPFHRTEEPR